MGLNEIINNYNNNASFLLQNLFNAVGKEMGLRINKNAAYWFSKDIKRKSKNVKPINIRKEDTSYKFMCNNKELFKINKRLFDRFNCNDSLLRTTLLPDGMQPTYNYDITNGQYLLGNNGLYEIEDNNHYRYLTFKDNKTIYYEANIDRDNGKIKKIFYDKANEIESIYLYNFKKNCIVDKTKSEAYNFIYKFLDEEFPKLSKNDFRRTYSDLVDQYFYDIKLVDKINNYKDINITKDSFITVLDKTDKNISGLSIKGNNRNKENFIALSNPSMPQIKLLGVTDFINGSSLDKSLTKYITLSLKKWFYSLDAKSLKNEKLLLSSLGDKLLNLNKDLNDEIENIKIKNKKIKNKKFGSSLGLTLVTKDNTYFINYGNTRVYASKDADIYPLTLDDTTIWNLYKKFKISEEEANMYQANSMLTNYVGHLKNNNNLPDLFKIKNDSYDKLFVFSDGVTNNLTNKTISTILKVNEGSESLREIIMQAHKNKKRDDDVTGCCYIKK